MLKKKIYFKKNNFLSKKINIQKLLFEKFNIILEN